MGPFNTIQNQSTQADLDRLGAFSPSSRKAFASLSACKNSIRDAFSALSIQDFKDRCIGNFRRTRKTDALPKGIEHPFFVL
ncbi:MAG: hypothetical protein IKA53_04410 [Clostridia bacterium]|nr:hypothetical protein [Clostridia bacterium]